MGADAATGRRMPPMLDITFTKLVGGGAKQMFTGDGRLGVHECHHILQLIAKTVGASGLIKSRPPPEPAAESLIKEPAICQCVEGWIGCVDVDRAKGAIPKLVHRRERNRTRFDAAETRD